MEWEDSGERENLCGNRASHQTGHPGSPRCISTVIAAFLAVT